MNVKKVTSNALNTLYSDSVICIWYIFIAQDCFPCIGVLYCILLRFLLPFEDCVRDDPVGGHGDVHDVAVNLALHARRHAALLVRLHVDQHLRFDKKKGGIF